MHYMNYHQQIPTHTTRTVLDSNHTEPVVKRLHDNGGNSSVDAGGGGTSHNDGEHMRADIHDAVVVMLVMLGKEEVGFKSCSLIRDTLRGLSYRKIEIEQREYPFLGSFLFIFPHSSSVLTRHFDDWFQGILETPTHPHSPMYIHSPILHTCA